VSHFILEKVSNPKTGWENKKIKYASKVFRGKFSHRPRNDESLYDGKYPFIQTGDVARASKYITEYSQTLNSLGYKVTTEFPKGTIVMTIAANIGDVAILGFNACFPDSVIGFYPKKYILNDFLYYALKVKKDDFLQTAIVNTQMNLNVERVSSIFIDIPPFAEQHKIVAEIAEHEKYVLKAISKAKKEISSIKEYREALITDLVTGKRSLNCDLE
jgi:type I restriction enzyme S subunit